MTPDVKPPTSFTVPTGPIPPSAELLKRRWTIRELRRLPKEWQKAILRAQAAAAEKFYRTDPEVLAWEAVGLTDLYGESSNIETCRTQTGRKFP